MNIDKAMVKNYISDTLVMTVRVLKHKLRSLDTIITVIVMPVMMMMGSVYIFGAMMDMPTNDYVNYLVPAIIVFSIVTGVGYSAVRLNIDVQKGIFERFHSMPISKSSILGGHILTSVIFNMLSAFCVVCVAWLMGFHPEGSWYKWIIAVGILLLFTVSMTWVAVASGLWAKTQEGAGVFSYLLLAITFTSSGFVKTDNMGPVLKAFADNQPLTPVMNSVRSLLVYNEYPPKGSLWVALVWFVAIWIVFQTLSIWIYKRRMS